MYKIKGYYAPEACVALLPNPALITEPAKIADMHILHGQPWGGRFQKSVIGERQFNGWNDRDPQATGSRVRLGGRAHVVTEARGRLA